MKAIAYTIVAAIIGLFATAIVTNTHTTLSEKLLNGGLLAFFGGIMVLAVVAMANDMEGK